MISMKPILSSAAIAVLLFFHPMPAAAQGSAVDGYYALSGTKPDGGTYFGEVTIATVMGDVHWLVGGVGGGAVENKGTGFFVANMLCMVWNPKGDAGLMVYAVTGGHLQGQWVSAGTRGLIGTERLEGPPGLEGVYNIVIGVDPTRDPTIEDPSYTGTVEIHKNGEIYNLVWKIDGQTYDGVGIFERGMLIAGWGPDAGVVYYELKDDKWEGRWTAAGVKTAGTETLFRR